MQHLPWRHLSISAISQLLLARLWPNLKGRFLGPFLTYSNCHNDICSGNICPYQEYLSCHWPDFDETLKVIPGTILNLFQHFSNNNKISSNKFGWKNFSTKNWPNFFRPKIFLTKKVYVKKILWTKNVFRPNFFCHQKCFSTNNYFNLNFGLVLVSLVLVLFLFYETNIFLTEFFGKKNFLGSWFLLGPTVFGNKILGTNFIWGPNSIF